MSYTVNFLNELVCQHCGSTDFIAEAKVKPNISLKLYNNQIYVKRINIEYYECDLSNIKCNTCGHLIAESFIELNEEFRV